MMFKFSPEFDRGFKIWFWTALILNLMIVGGVILVVLHFLFKFW